MEFFTMSWALIISMLFNIIIGYACYNLYNKTISLEQLLIEVNHSINKAVHNMRMVDSKGAFEADDEVGDTFKALLQIVNKLEGIINVEKEER